MIDNQQDIIEIINESFIGDSDKKKLNDIFNDEGESDLFFSTLNDILSVEVKKRGEVYDQVMTEFNNNCDIIEKEYQKQKEELEANLEKELSDVDLVDIHQREKLFDDCYEKIDSIQGLYEKNIKNMYSKLLTRSINET